jgi:hypothetical protein
MQAAARGNHPNGTGHRQYLQVQLSSERFDALKLETMFFNNNIY